MSKIPAEKIIPDLTLAQRGAFFDLLEKNIPAWLLSASDDVRRELYLSMITSYGLKNEVSTLLAALRSPEDFCLPLLTKAMSDRLGAPLDVTGVVFQHIRSTSSLFGLKRKLVLPINRNVLTAACDNFEQSETDQKNYSDLSTLYVPAKISGRKASILSIQPHEFAAMCRTLDLGKQYQAHLQSVLAPLVEHNELCRKCVAYSRVCFEVDRHLAVMKKHITAPIYQVLKAVSDNAPIKLGSNMLRCQTLKMLDMTINGALLIGSPGRPDTDDKRCVVYLPGDPLSPLKEYASFGDFEFQLSKRLRNTAYRKYFMSLIEIRGRAGFQAKLDKKLAASSGSPLPESSFFVSLEKVSFEGDAFAQIFRQRAAQIMSDARLMVVPTGDEDEKSRLARLETYEAIGVNILLIGASFVPVVGEILAAGTALQMLAQVYEGIASWSKGEQEQATDHLFDVVENLVLMAALAAGTAVGSKTLKAVRGSAFVESLRTVKLADATMRLWKPDLKAYSQYLAPPKGLVPDARGLRWVGNQAFLTIDKNDYAVRAKSASQMWEVLPPLGAKDRYVPLLGTNDLGAWRHDSELPGQWSPLTVFRRLGYSEQMISNDLATQILSVSNIDTDVLRRVLIDEIPPPALLTDTVRRFDTDKAVVAFIESLGNERSAVLADAYLQLQLIMTLKNWPKNIPIEVVDVKGRILETFKHERAGSQLQTAMMPSQDKLIQGEFHSFLLAGLTLAERETLLQTKTKVTAEQLSAFVLVLAEQASKKRVQLFNWIYERTAPQLDVRATPLLEQFPSLPVSAINELVHYAEAGERQVLEEGQIPLRLGEEARRYQQVLRVSRAYEGFYLDSVGWADTDRLVLDSLRQLPGWQNDINVTITQMTSLEGEAQSTIGPQNAVKMLDMSAYSDHYLVYDQDNNNLSNLSGRTRENYFKALWDGLTPGLREALGVQAGSEVLRTKITVLANERRTLAPTLLGIETWPAGYISPMRLADPVLLHTLETSPAPTGVQNWSAELIERAQEIYPTHTLSRINRFLIGLEGANRVMTLENMKAEFLNMQEVLQKWIISDTWYHASSGTRLKVSRSAKSQAYLQIIRCWRKETPAVLTPEGMRYELVFAPQPLGDLPVFTANFDHVGKLVMDRVGVSDGLKAFLHKFSHLRQLSLVGNELDRMPQAVGNMTHLENLDLSNNLIKLTSLSVNELAGLSHLRSLDLSYNPPLSETPNVGRMTQLERLQLRGSGISKWPQGASGLANLKWLDLRDNTLREIPEDVYGATISLNAGTNISGNPLTPNALVRLKKYQHLNKITLGLVASGRIESAVTLAIDVTMSAAWLTDIVGEGLILKRALWRSLYAYRGSEAFFILLLHLSMTADFRLTYTALRQRVWDTIEAACENDALRRTLFRMANKDRISADGYSLLFSDLHIRVLGYRAMIVIRTEHNVRERNVLALLKGLFRLEEVEKHALKNIVSRSITGTLTHEQAMEVSLALRVGLATSLNLPSQPVEFSNPLTVVVLPQTLDRVYNEIVNTEKTAALSDWLVGTQLWVEYLEGAHSNQFDAIVNLTAQASAQLDGQNHYGRPQFTQHLNAILSNHTNERKSLFRRLTAEALNRHPELVLPATRTATHAQQIPSVSDT
jgi:hypothetical protein